MDPTALLAGAMSSKSNLMANLLSIGAGLYKDKKNRDWQERQNEKDYEQTLALYDKQRQDALSDWASQNAYNHPLEQMNRLRQAGLNPHLVYGKGADTTADAIRSSGMSQVKRNPFQSSFDTGSIASLGSSVGQGFQTYFDVKAKQAQTDNVQQQTALMQEEALFKQASTAKTLTESAKTDFELKQAQELRDTTIENAKLQNEKLRADTQFSLDNNQRQELANSSNVQLTLEKIITEKIAHAKDQQQIELLKEQLNATRQSQYIQMYEEELTRMGIHKSDPWYFRGMMNLINGNIKEPKGPWRDFKNWVTGTQVPDYNMNAEKQFNRRK